MNHQQYNDAVEARISGIATGHRHLNHQDGYNAVFNTYQAKVKPAMASISQKMAEFDSAEGEDKPTTDHLFASGELVPLMSLTDLALEVDATSIRVKYFVDQYIAGLNV